MPGGQYVATGLEHSEAAVPRYDAATHREMTRKRMRKLEAAAKEAQEPHRYGDPEADLGIITWGSTTGVVVEAVERLRQKGVRVDVLAPRMIWPLPDHQLAPFIQSKRHILVPEVNYSGQYAQFLAARYRRDFIRLDVYEGQPLKVSKVAEAIEGVLQHV